jgi:hypothetical protein
VNKRFIVLVPLDGATNPNYKITFDYTEGDQPETVKYSLDNISGYALGSGATIQNINTNIRESWYSPNTSGYIIRQSNENDSNPYQDVSTSGTPAAIAFLYETALIPRDEDNTQTLHNFHGSHWRVKGSGEMSIAAFSVDHAQEIVPGDSPITLSLNPGQEILTRWILPNEEQQSIQFSTNGIGQYAIVSLIRVYYTEAGAQRMQ